MIRTLTRSVVLLRHGESTANATDRFGGRDDVGLTDAGRAQARAAGAVLLAHGLAPAVVHTSTLRRAVDTATLVVAQLVVGELHREVPVRRSAALDERDYGALEGRRRTDVVAEFGAEQVRRWRRSVDARPPAGRGPAESLADVRARVAPYWDDVIAADAGPVLVVAHGNSLRALCLHVDRLTPAEVEVLELPTAAPLVYRLDAAGRPLERGGTYL